MHFCSEQELELDLFPADSAEKKPEDLTAGGIVISSRIRLARNLRSMAFPGWAGDVERRTACDVIEQALAGCRNLIAPRFIKMDALGAADRMALQEQHLISHELAEGGEGRALLLDEASGLSVMINEEDHLRLQGLRTGLALEDIWRRLDALDDALSDRVDFAFDDRLGYLAACPSNVGTGMRASVMVQLSGLRIIGELDQVINALERLGLAVRGLLGEGTEAYGNIFQISNQSSLGEPESAIIAFLSRIAAALVQHERRARLRLLRGRRRLLEDQIGRAVGLISFNRMLPSGEAIDLLATLRLGVELGLVTGIGVDKINSLFTGVQPGHMQCSGGRGMTPDDRDRLRSEMLRTALAGVALRGCSRTVVQ